MSEVRIMNLRAWVSSILYSSPRCYKLYRSIFSFSSSLQWSNSRTWSFTRSTDSVHYQKHEKYWSGHNVKLYFSLFGDFSSIKNIWEREKKSWNWETLLRNSVPADNTFYVLYIDINCPRVRSPWGFLVALYSFYSIIAGNQTGGLIQTVYNQ